MVAMRRGSIFVPRGIHPRWVRCDAARFPAAQITSHPVLKESLPIPKYIFPGHGVVVEMRRGAHRAPSKENKERARCDAGLARHNWRKTRGGGDATRGFLCVCVAASGSLARGPVSPRPPLAGGPGLAKPHPKEPPERRPPRVCSVPILAMPGKGGREKTGPGVAKEGGDENWIPQKEAVGESWSGRLGNGCTSKKGLHRFLLHCVAFSPCCMSSARGGERWEGGRSRPREHEKGADPVGERMRRKTIPSKSECEGCVGVRMRSEELRAGRAGRGDGRSYAADRDLVQRQRANEELNRRGNGTEGCEPVRELARRRANPSEKRRRSQRRRANTVGKRMGTLRRRANVPDSEPVRRIRYSFAERSLQPIVGDLDRVGGGGAAEDETVPRDELHRRLACATRKEPTLPPRLCEEGADPPSSLVQGRSRPSLLARARKVPALPPRLCKEGADPASSLVQGRSRPPSKFLACDARVAELPSAQLRPAGGEPLRPRRDPAQRAATAVCTTAGITEWNGPRVLALLLRDLVRRSDMHMEAERDLRGDHDIEFTSKVLLRDRRRGTGPCIRAYR
eukprot:gene950-biopygen3475